MIFFECHHVLDQIREREKKKIPTQISNVTESVVYDISGQSHCRLRTAVAINGCN